MYVNLFFCEKIIIIWLAVLKLKIKKKNTSSNVQQIIKPFVKFCDQHLPFHGSRTQALNFGINC